MGGLEVGAFMLMFVLDEEELAYHSRPDTWQRSFGYNGFYDEIFNMATKMHYDMVTFNVRGTEYALWMWKGDYWNLKSGAEIGMYCNPTDIEGTTHYEVVPFELPMKNYFIFDEDGHTVWIVWDKKEESVFEKFKDYVVNSADIDGM